jgi:hypothetical protein
MTAKPRQRPEALAQFAETARAERREDRPGPIAKTGTSPLPTDPKDKDEAATKVLQEGAAGIDHGAEEAIDKLPDRIAESRHAVADIEQEEVFDEQRGAYDATSDPRTGRPPLPLVAEELNKERELQQLGNVQSPKGQEDVADDEYPVNEELDIDVMLDEDDSN